MKLPYIFVLTLALLLPIGGFAQKILGDKNFTLENDRIEDVIDSEKPEVVPEAATSFPRRSPDDSSSNVVIKPKEITVATDFTPAAPKFRSLELPEKPTKYADNYAKIGIGRYLTPMAQVYMARSKGANRYGVWFSHLSAHADSLKLRNFRENFATLWWEHTLKSSAISTEVKGYNTQYFRYADTTKFASDAMQKDSTATGFSRVDMNINWKSHFDEKRKLGYNVGFQGVFYQDKAQNREINLGVSPNGSYQINNDLRVKFTSEVAYIVGEIAQKPNNRMLLDIAPMMEYQHDALHIGAGLRYAYLNNGGENKTYGLPVPLLDIRYVLLPNALTLFAGLTGGLKTPRLYEFRQQNRFVSDSVLLRPMLERMNAFVGIRGNISEKIDYLAKISYRQVEHAQMYRYNAKNADFPAFYDSLTKIIGIHIEANYFVTQAFQAGVRADFNRFQVSSTASYFQVSPLRVDVYAAYTPIKSLKLRTETYVLGKTPMTTDASGAILYRKSVVGVNISADYQFARRVSAFVMVHNLLNQRYAQWYSYQERPLDYRAGITFHF